MLRRQAYQFELRPNGEQLRNLRQFAGSCRFVYNKALALNTERYNQKEKHLGYAGLCARCPVWVWTRRSKSSPKSVPLQRPFPPRNVSPPGWVHAPATRRARA